MDRLLLLIASLFISTAHLTTTIPTPTAPPTATPQVISFTVSPAEIDRGGFVNLTWDVRGVESVDIEQYESFSRKTSADVHYDNLPPQGSLTVQLTDGQPASWHRAEPYIYGADFVLLQHGNSIDDYGFRMLATKSVSIRCPYDGFFFGTDPYATFSYCPIAPAQTVDALYQTFDNGFMIWRADTQKVYVFIFYSGEQSDHLRGYGFTFDPTLYADPPTPYISPNPTAVSHAPVADPFAEARTLHNDFLLSLGGASAPAIAYQATVQDSYAVMFGFDVAYLTTPDDRVINFSTTLGTIWSYIS